MAFEAFGLWGGRWSWRDVLSFAGNPAPIPGGGTLITADSGPMRIVHPVEDRLWDEAAKAGIRVCDLRGYSRSKLYKAKDRLVIGGEDFGKWGYFRTRNAAGKVVFKEIPPKRGRAHGTRPWAKMHTTMLHTAATSFEAARAIGFPVQCAIADDGTIVLCHPLNAYLWHGHNLNRESTGVEIAGKSSITERQIVALRILLRYIDSEKRDHGVEQQYVVPHTFSQKRKPHDCGGAIWEAGARWAMTELDWHVGRVVRGGSVPKWVTERPSNR